MSETVLASKYIRALESSLENANKISDLDAVIQIIEALSADTKRLNLLKSTTCSLSEQKELLHPLIEPYSTNPKITRFFELILEKKRLSLLHSLQKIAEAQLIQLKKLIPCTIYTAQSITDETANQITSKLQDSHHSKIDPTFKKDLSLIGGFKAIIGLNIYDASIQKKLDNFKSNIKTKYN